MTDKPAPKKCEYVDGVFGKCIKSEPQKHQKHKHNIIPSNMSGVIIGRTGAGKTWELKSIVPAINNLAHIIYASCVIGNSVAKALRDHCDAEQIEFHEVSDPTELIECVNACADDRDQDAWNLIIADDFNTGRKQGVNSPFTDAVANCYSKLRNKQFHMITLAQNYNMISTIARACCNFMIIFQCVDEFSTRNLLRDCLNIVDTDKETMYELYRAIKDDIHSHLYVSRCNDDSGRVFIVNKQTGGKLAEVALKETQYEPSDDEHLRAFAKSMSGPAGHAHGKKLHQYLKYVRKAHGEEALHDIFKKYPVFSSYR